MKRALFCSVVLAAAGCSPEAPPKPVSPALAAKPLPAVPVSVPHIASEPAPEKPDPNKELARRVQRALEDEARIHAAAIDVTAKGGVVTLWGTAATPDERQRASRVAYRVNGVTAVNNKLAIASGS
ncbi:MAG TPA: BON domain-containing protein [Burkholderiales bacterium]|nr:BON domain-containing protein [Burkholderiales bacterium]